MLFRSQAATLQPAARRRAQTARLIVCRLHQVGGLHQANKGDMMRVFVAGASGAIGARLVPQLAGRGHQVIGTCRSPGRAQRLQALGAEPIVVDVLDSRAVRKTVAGGMAHLAARMSVVWMSGSVASRSGAARPRAAAMGPFRWACRASSPAKVSKMP